MPDVLAQRVYEWERDVVEPKSLNFLSREECLELAGRAALFLGIPAPSLRISKAASMPCRAIPSKWQIVIAGWGRTPVTLLHEVAHLGSLKAVAKGENPHGPAFVATAIALYARFLGLDAAKLSDSARQYGVGVGTQAFGPVDRTARVPDFSDLEF